MVEGVGVMEVGHVHLGMAREGCALRGPAASPEREG
jgi:hypothetical protein